MGCPYCRERPWRRTGRGGSSVAVQDIKTASVPELSASDLGRLRFPLCFEIPDAKMSGGFGRFKGCPIIGEEIGLELDRPHFDLFG